MKNLEQVTKLLLVADTIKVISKRFPEQLPEARMNQLVKILSEVAEFLSGHEKNGFK